MKTLRIIFNLLFAVANVASVLLLVMSAYSDRVSPESSIIFSYLGLLFPLLCVLNLLFIIYWLFLSEWRYMMIGLCAFMLCWGSVRSYFPFHQPSDMEGREVLKVLTYNVMAFGYKNHTKDSPNKILDYIANSDADIVCMQEFAVSRSNSNLTTNKIYRALRMYPYRSVFYKNSTKTQRYGIAVFSKYPISNSRLIKYDSDFNGSSVHEIEVKGKRLTLINNHLESFKLTMEDRSRYSSLIKSFSSDGLDELKGAFERKLGPAFRIRAKQAESVAAEVNGSKNDYVIVCGDFNDTPISYAHRTIQGGLKDAFAESGRGIGVTYNQNFFWFRIDHILHSPNIKAYNCTIDKVSYSDHYPVWCYISLE